MGEGPIGIVLLAAGASVRMGRTKQLLTYQGVSLVRRGAASALAADCGPVIVVLGAQGAEVAKELTGCDVHLHFHRGWHEGIGSSLRAGLMEAMARERALAGVLIMLCDQALVGSPQLHALISTFRATSKLIAAASYNRTMGAPAIFDRVLFPQLCALPFHQGAKMVLLANLAETESVAMPEAVVDVDTFADYKTLLRRREARR